MWPWQQQTSTFLFDCQQVEYNFEYLLCKQREYSPGEAAGMSDSEEDLKVCKLDETSGAKLTTDPWDAINVCSCQYTDVIVDNHGKQSPFHFSLSFYSKFFSLPLP